MMKRILIIEVNWLGDILFTTPAIRAIRGNSPGAFIACMAVPRCVEMLECNPDIDEIIVYDERGIHRGIFGKISFIKQLKARNFDMAISFHRSMTRILIAYLAGIKRRIAYRTKKNAWLLTDGIAPPAGQAHRIEHFLGITRALGMDTKDISYEFCVPGAASKNADAILKNEGIAEGEGFFVVNPGANWLPKRWPKENFTELCRRLNGLYGKKIVITGSRKDMPLADYIISNSDNSAVNLCGKTTLKELAAVMKRASVVITNDSGPMHIALSQKTPVVALFGPTSPKITGPYAGGRYIVIHKWFDCEIPCYKICHDYRCMEAISVSETLDAVRKLI